MRLTDLIKAKNGQRCRVSAKVAWEDCDRPDYDIFFETELAFADGLIGNPNAFLLATAIPAWFYGEKRVLVEDEICPELTEGLLTAMGWIQHWFKKTANIPAIEGKKQQTIAEPRTPERAACFFSGGIDSMATLRANHLNFPKEHPWRIKDGLLVYGFEIYSPESFEIVKEHLSKLARRISINLIPVYTNHYLVFRKENGEHDFGFWTHEYIGAALAAVAHSFAKRFTVVSIASSHNIPSLVPYGSNPLLDPNYSSCDLRIRYDNIRLARLEKTAMIAQWDDALQNLRVCDRIQQYKPDQFNCGKCEKCVRTMLALIVQGALDKTKAFPHRDVTKEMILKCGRIPSDRQDYYLEMLKPLDALGRHDLVAGIKESIGHY